MNISPNLLQNSKSGKGKQIEYTLVPISFIKGVLNLSSPESDYEESIDEETISALVKLFDEISEVDNNLNDITEETNRYSVYFEQDDVDWIRNYQYNYKLFQTEFKNDLADQVKLIRKGKASVSTLNDVITSASNKTYSWINVKKTKFDFYQNEISFIKLLQTYHVEILAKNTVLPEFLLNDLNKVFYVLFYTKAYFDDAKFSIEDYLSMVKSYGSYGYVFAAQRLSFHFGDSVDPAKSPSQVLQYNEGKYNWGYIPSSTSKTTPYSDYQKSQGKKILT